MVHTETRLATLIFRWVALAALAGTAFWLTVTYRQSGVEGLRELGQLSLVSVLILGKFVIFSGLHADTPSPWTLALLVWLIDIWIGIGLANGLESLERAPLVGRWLRRMRRKALRVFADYPGLERMAFFGVVTFVLLPLASTGAITGSFAARLLGLSRLGGLAAIALGSMGTAVLFASLATFLGERAEHLARSPILALIGLTVVGWIGVVTYRRILGRLKAGPSGASPTSPGDADAGEERGGEPNQTSSM